jgi:hypothetical protein
MHWREQDVPAARGYKSLLQSLFCRWGSTIARSPVAVRLSRPCKRCANKGSTLRAHRLRAMTRRWCHTLEQGSSTPQARRLRTVEREKPSGRGRVAPLTTADVTGRMNTSGGWFWKPMCHCFDQHVHTNCNTQCTQRAGGAATGKRTREKQEAQQSFSRPANSKHTHTQETHGPKKPCDA